MSLFVIWAAVACTIGFGWAFSARTTLNRPPIGVFNSYDCFLLFAGIIAVPLLYLLVPAWCAGLMLALVTASVLSSMAEGLGQRRIVRYLIPLVALASDVSAAWLAGPQSAIFTTINDGVMILVVVGIATLWVQGGMGAGHATFLGALLTGYDAIATLALPVMHDLNAHMAGLPFAAQVSWSGASIGLGDLLMLTVFPLILRKAYNTRAGAIAAVLGLAVIAGIAIVPVFSIFPVMIVLGPLMLGQYLYWSRLYPQERRWADLLAQSASVSYIGQQSNRQPAICIRADVQHNFTPAELV